MPAQIACAREGGQNRDFTTEQNDEAPLSHAANVASRTVHIIIPVLNEAAALAVMLPLLPAGLRPNTIVVDNGSIDDSAAVALAHGAQVVRENRRGYGSACLAGIAALRAQPDDDVVIFMDGDASDDIDDLPRLLDPLDRDAADLVIGSRVLGTRERGALSPHARFGNWLATAWIHRRTGVRFTDLGPLRAIRISTLRSLDMHDPDYGWTVEMQLKAVQRKLRVVEVPVRYRKRIGRSKISGTIIGSARAGFTILRTIARHGA
jgi:glycosyltransferase involved in cell wall biosynthesis